MAAILQKSLLAAQFVAWNANAHLHLYASTPSLQVAPFMHGLEVHSSMSVSQLEPEKPATQEHLYAFAATDLSEPDSAQVAPFLHGLAAHSFLSREQFSPK
jgi:hypothetical protein